MPPRRAAEPPAPTVARPSGPSFPVFFARRLHSLAFLPQTGDVAGHCCCIFGHLDRRFKRDLRGLTSQGARMSLFVLETDWEDRQQDPVRTFGEGPCVNLHNYGYKPRKVLNEIRRELMQDCEYGISYKIVICETQRLIE